MPLNDKTILLSLNLIYSPRKIKKMFLLIENTQNLICGDYNITNQQASTKIPLIVSTKFLLHL